MIAITVALIWAAVAALFIARLDRWAHRWLDLREPAPATPSPDEIPDDLMAYALGESEKWAQEHTIELIQGRWDTFRDWNKVRASLGVAAVSA